MRVRIEAKGPYLLATFGGHLSSRGATRAFKTTCDAAAQQGFDKILVDCLAVDGELSLPEISELRRNIAAHYLLQNMCTQIALISHAPAINVFAERLNSEPGLVVEAFSEVQSALQWLNPVYGRLG